MTDRGDRLCPVGLAGSLDNRLRRWLQDPRHILEPWVREGMTALDFGCGPGFCTLELARLVGPSGHVIAADLQAGMLEKVGAKVRGTPVETRIALHQCQPDRIGLLQPVDFALAFWVVHELPDPAPFFHEIRQLLSAGGRLLVVEPPLHVSRAAFEKSLGAAEQAGLTISTRPRVPFNKAALLRPA